MRARVLLTLASLTIAVLAGCDARTVEVAIDPSKTTYSRDVRTNQCMGTVGRANGSAPTNAAESFTTWGVPCTPEVLAYVPLSQGGGGRTR